MSAQRTPTVGAVAAKPSRKIIFGLIALMAAASGGLGFALGFFSPGGLFDDKTTESPTSAQSDTGHSTGHAGAPDNSKDTEETKAGNQAEDDHAENGQSKSITLDPVLTNISSPSDVWVRFESILQLSEPLPKEVTDQIHQDFLAYFHSLRLSELTGSSAFLDLKTELLARANVRAEGKVRAVYIKTFLFE